MKSSSKVIGCEHEPAWRGQLQMGTDSVSTDDSNALSTIVVGDVFLFLRWWTTLSKDTNIIKYNFSLLEPEKRI